MSRVLLSTALLLALAGCDFLLPGDDSFMPGEIVLSVKQEVTIDFVESYAAARGLEVLDQFFPEVYLMWAAVTDGDVERHLEYLQASPLCRTPTDVRAMRFRSTSSCTYRKRTHWS